MIRCPVELLELMKQSADLFKWEHGGRAKISLGLRIFDITHTKIWYFIPMSIVPHTFLTSPDQHGPLTTWLMITSSRGIFLAELALMLGGALWRQGTWDENPCHRVWWQNTTYHWLDGWSYCIFKCRGFPHLKIWCTYPCRLWLQSPPSFGQQGYSMTSARKCSPTLQSRWRTLRAKTGSIWERF